MLRIHSYFETAIARRASDLHLKCGSPPTLRIGGRLVPLPEEPLAHQEMPNLFLPLMDVRQQEQFRACLEANFMINYQNRWRIRACIFRQRGSLSGAFRFIPTKVPSIDQLKLPVRLKEMALRPRGLFLVTGPANSGKSHTLAAMVHEINKSSARHIVTIEDPIEFVHKPRRSIFTQREIGLMTKDYQSALIYALREDPDVILVGEMRDITTIEMVLTAAETGHLVLSTLHTVGAVQTIDRIINVFPGHRHDEIRTQLSLSLLGTISQILLPGREKNERVMAYELMILNPAMRNLIREKKTNQLKSALMLARKEGCVTLKDNLTELLRDERVDARLINALMKEIVE
ncbi:MAG: Twitching motility protein PilT [Candidatus Ozemobacter sibiricus]|jgi:twitching motility protein PilT|uniref:Twitching motility protein PilT n=1 Tax=Candidatus Ozemobacter sibiricus TaxID=2268124 RepID=A0A367ZR84_9BACT|nr:MAG: Twitching motility protein PilT [Candidatus Ozemobacter sibiricus]